MDELACAPRCALTSCPPPRTFSMGEKCEKPSVNEHPALEHCRQTQRTQAGTADEPKWPQSVVVVVVVVAVLLCCCVVVVVVVVVVVCVVCVVCVVVVVRTVCFTSVSDHSRARMQQIKMGQCQCTDPFGWTDQPEPPTPVPSEGRFQASPMQTITQPQGEEKDCEARPPHPPSPSEEGGRNLFHLLGVGCPGSGS